MKFFKAISLSILQDELQNKTVKLDFESLGMRHQNTRYSQQKPHVFKQGNETTKC